MGFDVLIAFLVVAAIGLIAGVLLCLAAHFLYVPADETETKIRECLPGVNCGACGYAGCDDYAKALAEGGVKTNLCVPGGDGTSAEISKILGVEYADVEEMVAFVKCNGGMESITDKAVYDGINTCRAASMIYGGPHACRFGCVGCGDCALECPVSAICIKDGIAHIDPRICIGCGLCVKTCPKGIIELVPLERKIIVMCSSHDKGAVARKACKNACIACKKCELNCPEEAITVVDNLATIDYSRCTACGICADSCPTGCIKKVDFLNSED